jgi:hypothetical protein
MARLALELAGAGVLVAACGSAATNSGAANDAGPDATGGVDGGSGPGDASSGSDAQGDGAPPGTDAMPQDAAATGDASAGAGPCDPSMGQPVELASATVVAGLAIDDSWVYFGTAPIGIGRVSKAGGPVQQPPTSDGGAAQRWSIAGAAGIAVAGGYAYWPPDGFGLARVPTAAFSAMEPALIATPPSTVGSIDGRSVAASDTTAYLSDTSSQIWAVPASGGTLGRFAMASSSNAVLAVDSSGVYWAALVGGTFQASPDGGAPLLLAAGYPNGLALDATSVYTTTTDGHVVAVPKGGGTATPIDQAPANTGTGGIAVDDAYVYWTHTATSDGGTTGAVHKVSKTGGSSTVLATTTSWVMSIAVDATCVYYTDGAKVMRVAK